MSNPAPPSISIVVQGRFHAFALAKALQARQVPVRVLTNYPKSIAAGFGIQRDSLATCPALGLLHRISYRTNLVKHVPAMERFLHVTFSKWAARQFERHPTDVIHAFSGVALELFQSLKHGPSKTIKQLTRGSVHIREQYQILRQEEKLSGRLIEKPSSWMIHREMLEYQMADHIVVLSTFAKQSFLRHGYSEDKLLTLKLGSDLGQFRPDEFVLNERIRRILSGEPLRLFYAGTVSMQKGFRDLSAMAKQLKNWCHLQIVGNVAPDAQMLVDEAGSDIEFLPRVHESDLPSCYAANDIFLFPTLQDGYALVLDQALASCLPVLATSHCAAPDLVQQDQTGWVLPINRPDLFVERIRWCHENRQKVAEMIQLLWQKNTTRDWSQVAHDYLAFTKESLLKRQARSRH